MHDTEAYFSPHIKGRIKRIHFIGIGGAGMGGIAEVLKNLDYEIRGSDVKETSITKRLRSLGIKISKIGKICSPLQKSQIINEKNVKITIKNKGYFHRF